MRVTRRYRWFFFFIIMQILFSASAQNQAKTVFKDIQRDLDLTPEQETRLKQIKQSPATKEIRIVTVDSTLLRGDSQPLVLNLFDEMNVKVQGWDLRETKDSEIWDGKLENKLDSAIFVLHEDKVTGTVKAGSGWFSIRPLGGSLHAIVENDSKRLPQEHPPEFKNKEKQDKRFNRPNITKADSAPQHTLRVLVAYTEATKKQFEDIDGLIDLAIAETNKTYLNSGVKIQAELADRYLVNYTESGSFDTDLKHFRVKKDNIMDEVHQRRDDTKADISVLLIDSNSYCGLAETILAKEDEGFAVVYHQCATGYYSFAHEIGHLQGARHNIEADPTKTPFAYGHGYCYKEGNWRTVMSYDCALGSNRLPFWSNPDQSYNGNAMGTKNESENSRVLNETAPVITAFRQ